MSTFGRYLLNLKTDDDGIIHLREECLKKLGKTRLVSIRHPRQIQKRVLHNDVENLHSLTRACRGYTIPPRERVSRYFGRWLLSYWGHDPAVLEFRNQLSPYDSIYMRRSTAATCRVYVDIDDKTFQTAVETFQLLRRIQSAKTASSAIIIDQSN